MPSIIAQEKHPAAIRSVIVRSHRLIRRSAALNDLQANGFPGLNIGDAQMPDGEPSARDPVGRANFGYPFLPYKIYSAG